MKVVVTACLFIAWIGIIVFASSQPYSQQDLRPMLTSWDLSWVERLFSWVEFTYSQSLISIETKGTAGFIEFFIRKGAHVVVYATLGFLASRLLRATSIRLFYQVLLAFLFVVLFAMSDEYRHSLNPERTGLIEDVILDSVGGIIGIAFYHILYRIKVRILSRRSMKR
ncbi:VanZ family protein [Halalkalibacter urbisdiaboli]|uniref:VanZ family protein n=1 Tax=Halalkalibacter urbisdiaboli TaxID=1960589 RepID=UPI000B437F91|nr:VanZ family protein [Halalkalibacter urbisdiaboli]